MRVTRGAENVGPRWRGWPSKYGARFAPDPGWDNFK